MIRDDYQFNLIHSGIPELTFNGTEVYSEWLRDESYFVIEYLSGFKAQILKKDLSDVYKNKDEIFYFVLTTFQLNYEILNDVLKSDTSFSNIFIELMKLDNVVVVLIDVHEIDPPESIDTFIQSLKIQNVNLNNIHIINNDSNIEFYKNKFNWPINVHKTNHLISNSCRGFLEMDYEFIEEKKGPYFLCKNKVGKPHRINILAFLDECGLLMDTNYSLLTPRAWEDYYYSQDPVFNEHKSVLPFVYKYLKSNPIHTINEPHRDDFFNESININFAGDLNTEDYKNSYVNITTESVFMTNNLHISEKSFKPFAFYQIPIFIASPGHCQILKNYYKMDLYEDLIDYSYDLEMDDAKRFLMLFDEIKKLHKNKDSVKKYYKENKKRFEYNRNRVVEIAKPGIDIDIFKSIVNYK